MKKLTSILLTLVFVFALVAVPVQASDLLISPAPTASVGGEFAGVVDLIPGDNDTIVTRAQFAIAITGIVAPSALSNYASATTVYSDVTPGTQAAAAIKYCTDNGFMNGYLGTTFGPNDPILREQAFVVLARVLGIKETEKFDETDLTKAAAAQATPYASKILEVLAGFSFVKGYGDNQIGAQDPLTKIQVNFILNQSICDVVTEPGTVNVSNDSTDHRFVLVQSGVGEVKITGNPAGVTISSGNTVDLTAVTTTTVAVEINGNSSSVNLGNTAATVSLGDAVTTAPAIVSTNTSAVTVSGNETVTTPTVTTGTVVPVTPTPVPDPVPQSVYVLNLTITDTADTSKTYTATSTAFTNTASVAYTLMQTVSENREALKKVFNNGTARDLVDEGLAKYGTADWDAFWTTNKSSVTGDSAIINALKNSSSTFEGLSDTATFTMTIGGHTYSLTYTKTVR